MLSSNPFRTARVCRTWRREEGGDGHRGHCADSGAPLPAGTDHQIAGHRITGSGWRCLPRAAPQRTKTRHVGRAFATDGREVIALTERNDTGDRRI